MNEFTGERVIPGQVNTDLWNEHLSRYAFAERFARDAAALDVGCGSGYGAATIARSATSVVGTDFAVEALQYAREHFPLPNLSFVASSADALPFSAERFDVVTAFEVLEHLSNWRGLIAEARRVTKAEGLFLVSTPNKLYYAEQRSEVGPNPYHQHEFEVEEFVNELRACFPSVSLMLQNRSEAFAFYPRKTLGPADAQIASRRGESADAHFFVAICSSREPAPPRSFVYVPLATNVLREREQHIHALEDEVALNQKWLAEVQGERDQLHDNAKELNRHIEEQNRWAQELEANWRAAQARVVQLQDEFKAAQQAALEVAQAYQEKVGELERLNEEKTHWALDTESRLMAEIEAHRAKIVEILNRLDEVEETVVERTKWAQALEAQLQQVNQSRWVRLGQKFGLGPSR